MEKKAYYKGKEIQYKGRVNIVIEIDNKIQGKANIQEEEVNILCRLGKYRKQRIKHIIRVIKLFLRRGKYSYRKG